MPKKKDRRPAAQGRTQAMEFPKGFLWGAATSAHQVEGNNFYNDWWEWERSGKTKEVSGIACDHFRRFEEDFDLAAKLSHNVHRFSIEWSRIEPVEGCFDEKALAHYRKVVDALRVRSIEPIVTLHHFTNPAWFLKSGGWTQVKAVDRYLRYVKRVVQALGTQVRWWITINEPMVYIYMHYLTGEGPPGGKGQLGDGLKVLDHMIRAHAGAYHLLHQANPNAQVSIAKFLTVFRPCRKHSLLDRLSVRLSDKLFNTVFLDAVTEGRWAIPGRRTQSLQEARNTLDFLGLNYYRPNFIRSRPLKGDLLGEACDVSHHKDQIEEITDWMRWPVVPSGFTEVLMRFSKLKLPILVTENGTSMEDDSRRWRFIERHLSALHEASAKGVKVIGYCYWSLMDNFEWAHGFEPRFGLIEVDRQTRERRLRPSAIKYAKVCKSNRLEVTE